MGKSHNTLPPSFLSGSPLETEGWEGEREEGRTEEEEKEEEEARAASVMRGALSMRRGGGRGGRGLKSWNGLAWGPAVINSSWSKGKIRYVNWHLQYDEEGGGEKPVSEERFRDSEVL